MDEKISKLLETPDFVAKMEECNNAETFQIILRQFSIELDVTDAETAYEQFLAGRNKGLKESEELNESELSAVAGGVNLNPFYWIGYGLGRLFSRGMNICV